MQPRMPQQFSKYQENKNFTAASIESESDWDSEIPLSVP